MRKRVLIVTMIALALGGLVVLFMMLRPKPTASITYYQSNILARNIQFSHAAGDRVRYFTGSAFAEYDPATNKSSALTPELRLPLVTDVRWTDSGALFRATNYTPRDELYEQLGGDKSLITDSYWWQVSFDGKTASRLKSTGGAIADVITAGSSGERYVLYGAGTELKLAKEGGGADVYMETIRTSLPVRLAGSTASGALAKQGLALHFYPKAGGPSRKLSDRVQDVATSGDWVVYSVSPPPAKTASEDTHAEESEDPYTLQAYNTTTNKRLTLSRDFKGVFTISQSRTMVINAAEADIEGWVYDLETGRLSRLQISPATDELSAPNSLLATGADNLYAATTSNELFALRVSQDAIIRRPGINLAPLDAAPTAPQGISFEYEFITNRLTISSDLPKPFSQIQADALNQISRLGADPHQIIKHWVIGAGDD